VGRPDPGSQPTCRSTPHLTLVRRLDRDALPVNVADRGDDVAGHVHVPVPVGVGEASPDRVFGVSTLVDVQPDGPERLDRFPRGAVRVDDPSSSTGAGCLRSA
jgi:hypothetical protein